MFFNYTSLASTSEATITQSVIEEMTSLQTDFYHSPQLSNADRFITVTGFTESSLFLKAEENIELFAGISAGLYSLSVTQPSKNNFLKQKLDELNNMYALLHFENDAVLEIGADIIQDCLKQKKFDFKISRTGDNELLIFREIEGAFNNIIIDKDGDIEYLHIPINRKETFNEYYAFIDNIDTFELASKL